jgi:hypothetical protein
MKQIYLLLILIFSVLETFSQENDSIIVVQSPKGRLSGLINVQDLAAEGNRFGSEKFEGNWSGIEFGINGFARPDYSAYQESDGHFLSNDALRSNILNLNVLQYSKGLQQFRNNFGVITGLGLSFKSYRLDHNTTIFQDESGKIQPMHLYYDSSQKSKFSLLYLDVPLLLEIQIPVNHINNRFYFSAGLIGSKLLEAHTKIKYRKDGKKEKLKSPGGYGINDYKVAATIRLGYRWINIFASYDLVPLFEERKGPKLYPFSAGVRLISF